MAGVQVDWSTSDSTVVEVDESGLVHARLLGTAQVTARTGGASGSATVRVIPIPVATVRISPDSVVLFPDSAVQLEVELLDAGGDPLEGRPVTWSSDDSTVARVDASGLVRAGIPGEARVRAEAGDASGSTRIKVVPVPVGAVEVRPSEVMLSVGESTRLSAIVTDLGGDTVADRPVSWSSGDPDLVRAGENGFVNAVGAGSVEVTATAGGVTGLALITVEALPPGISAADSAALTVYLDQLRTEWIQSAVSGANQILARPHYSATQWESFFTGYLLPRTQDHQLLLYLHLPVFYWLSEDRRRALQRGLFPVALRRMDALVEEHGDGLLALVSSDGALDEDLRFWTDLFGHFRQRGLIPEQRSTIAERLTAYLDRLPGVLFGEMSPARGIRRLNAMVFSGLLEAEPLTNGRRTELASLFRLGQEEAAILHDFGVLVDGRYQLSGQPSTRIGPNRLAVIHRLLDVIPSALHDLGVVTVLDTWGLFPRVFHCCFYTRYFGPAVISIGEPRLRRSSSNPFPSDIEPRQTPFFSTLLVHEFNHAVDNLLYTGGPEGEPDPEYRSRRDQLVAAAGADSLNYLRSMIRSGFFQQHPVELFSSTTQQWFVDSEHTLALGRLRFEGGRPHPMNQALWVAEVFSTGGGTTPLFRMLDPDGAVEVYQAPVTRDINGHIDSIRLPDSVWHFERDAEGNVLTMTVTEG